MRFGLPEVNNFNLCLYPSNLNYLDCPSHLVTRVYENYFPLLTLKYCQKTQVTHELAT